VRRQERPQARLEILRREGGLETVLPGLVDAEDRGAAGAGDEQEPLPRRPVHVGEPLGEVVELLQVVGPHDAVLPEDGLVDLVAAGQGLRVALGRDAPPCRSARFEDHDGFGGLAERIEERRGALHALDVAGDDPRVGIVVEVPDAVGLVHVGPVAEAHEAAEAQALDARPVDEGGAHGAALGDEGDAPSRGDERPGGAEAAVGDIHPLAVGPDEAHAVLPARLRQLRLELLAVLARLGKPAGDDHGGLHARPAALLDGPHDHPRGDDHYGHVRGRRGRTDRRVGLEAQDLVGLRVDGVDRPRKPGLDQVVKDVVAELPGCARRADKGHACRLEDGIQRSDRIHRSSSFVVRLR